MCASPLGAELLLPERVRVHRRAIGELRVRPPEEAAVEVRSSGPEQAPDGRLGRGHRRVRTHRPRDWRLPRRAAPKTLSEGGDTRDSFRWFFILLSCRVRLFVFCFFFITLGFERAGEGLLPASCVFRSRNRCGSPPECIFGCVIPAFVPPPGAMRTYVGQHRSLYKTTKGFKYRRRCWRSSFFQSSISPTKRSHAANTPVTDDELGFTLFDPRALVIN